MSLTAFATLDPKYRTDGASLLNLSRSIGASAGASGAGAAAVPLLLPKMASKRLLGRSSGTGAAESTLASIVTPPKSAPAIAPVAPADAGSKCAASSRLRSASPDPHHIFTTGPPAARGPPRTLAA